MAQAYSSNTIAAPASATITAIVDSLTLEGRHNGLVLRSDSDFGVTVTVSRYLPEGFTCAVAQWGNGTVTVAEAGSTNQSGTTATSAQYNMLSLIVVKNADGASAEFIVAEA